jgi:hypothetical protein
MSKDSQDSEVICRACGHSMKLVRTITRLGGLPELHVFACPSCHEVEPLELKQAA